MGKPRIRQLPGAPGKTKAATNPNLCPERHRCHACGDKIYNFGLGNAFLHTQIFSLVDYCVMIEDNTGKQVASGFILEYASKNNRAVVLMAEHTMSTLSVTDLLVRASYRLNGQLDTGGGSNPSAPGGSYELQAPEDVAAWEGTPTAFWTGKGLSTIEQGNDSLDYRLIEVQFSPGAFRLTTFRYFQLSKTLGDEVLLLGHPYKRGQNFTCNGAMGSAGSVTRGTAKFYETDSLEVFAYANLSATSGFSGGAVFNTDMKIVGVLKGKTRAGDIAFLNLGAVVDSGESCPELTKYMNGESRYATKDAAGEWSMK